MFLKFEILKFKWFSSIIACHIIVGLNLTTQYRELPADSWKKCRWKQRAYNKNRKNKAIVESALSVATTTMTATIAWDYTLP